MLNKIKKLRGFTLIELIIVIAIIAILAAIAVPAFGQIRQKANVSADIGNARSIYSVVTSLVADETIVLPHNGTNAEANRKAYTFYDLEAVGEGTDIRNLVKEDLAGVSNPKTYQGTEFMVGLNGDGDVKIIVITDDKAQAKKSETQVTTAKAVEIYPNPTDRYLQK